jgi:hypothetical protein
MTWVYPETDLDRFTLYDLYKINYSWPIYDTLAGYWSPGTGLHITLTQYKYTRRKDMKGIVFTAALVVSCHCKATDYYAYKILLYLRFLSSACCFL